MAHNNTTLPTMAQGDEALAISPTLIVGIVIAGAFALVILMASVFRFCIGGEGGDEGEAFNPNRPRPVEQLARMREVRRANKMYLWQRGVEARVEIGELGPAGEHRTWDELSSLGDRSSGSSSTTRRQGDIHPVEDHSAAAFFYNADDPYAESSSRQQRLNYLAPPTSARNSYQTTSSDYNSRRRSSVLLPNPLHHLRESRQYPGSPSPLRHEYLISNPYLAEGVKLNLESPDPLDSTTTTTTTQTPPAMATAVGQHGPNPRITITINDNDTEDIATTRLLGSAFQAETETEVEAEAEADNFEPATLYGGGHETEGEDNIPESSAMARQRIRIRDRPTVSFLLEEREAFPAFKPRGLDLDLPARQSHGAVGVLYDHKEARASSSNDHTRDALGIDGGNDRNDHNTEEIRDDHSTQDMRGDHNTQHQDMQDDQRNTDTDTDHDHADDKIGYASGPPPPPSTAPQSRARQDSSSDGVKNLVQEWETKHGRFDRHF